VAVEIDRKRLHLLGGLAGLLIAAPLSARSLLEPTPRQPAGPFYPAELPVDDDNDLTRVRGRAGIASGEISDLTGRILGPDGRPLAGMRIEIWQCDANGRYHHPDDAGRGPLDLNFQGFGHTVTDAEGRYRFRTIRPVEYPGRTPHIHVAVRPEWDPPFVTQLYVRGDPRNERDFLFRRIPAERRHLVQADFSAAAAGEARLAAVFDIVLGGEGTPRA
jgi:protocatechuate 3,4-dioxygenase beta subunit